MAITELINALNKNDLSVKKELFEQGYKFMSGIALRIAKNEIQAKQLINSCFNNCIQAFLDQKQSRNSFEEFLEKQFLIEAVNFIKSIRSEYYVASTVLAASERDKTINLFDNNEIIDFSSVETPVLIKSLQELVPSQRLVFNLHVIDGLDMANIAEILEASEQTVKSNLEKARYNLQKNIEKNYKNLKHEQAF